MSIYPIILWEEKIKGDIPLTDFGTGVVAHICYFRELEISVLSMKLTYGGNYTVNLRRKTMKRGMRK